MERREERYVIRGGKEGYQRLLVLSRDRWPDTLALLKRAEVRSGMNVLDLGCGGGEVTLELARLVGPQGRVTGVDMDAVKLDLARGAAAERKIPNVEFRRQNVNEWDEPDAYDAVYSRFLLHHLQSPVELLRRMWAAVRREGVLIIEDADFDGWCADPANDGFDFFVRVYSDVVRHHGGDPTLGRKLRRYLLDAGVPDPELALVQPVRRTGEAKALPWSTLEASSEAILSAKLATPGELTSALESLAQFVENPATITSGPRIFQAWIRRT